MHPWHAPEVLDDGVDLTLLLALAHEALQWSLAVGVQPVDDVPQIVTTPTWQALSR